ncbi:phosphatidylinositol 3,4,5-trisphosphate 3-phosphatase TPTE2-like [Perognathus longimembris pacificus]|uniref:phosphatidylinositol 3,4,5-trisphosphate 3-phosphatase TPTE2-like n=1 Tax=Perognathus longimembris pacificus TaxID=214514 RepID=UPI00201908C3|nr:phosphatidylinositol 3,4,5-trisphosphate 3-phosphatase TPTE2-like [Perognathus longimembris pacificus]
MPPFWKQTGSPRALEAACQGLAARRSRWAVRAPRWTRLTAVYGTSRVSEYDFFMGSIYIQNANEHMTLRDDCGLQAVVVESKEDSIDGTCEDEVCSAPNDDNVSERTCVDEVCSAPNDDNVSERTCEDEVCSAPNDDNVSERTCEDEVCSAPNDDNVSERDDCGLQALVVELKEESIDGNIPSDTTIEIEEWNNNNERHHIKKIANGILSSIAFRILEILLIFIDLALMGTDVVITMTKLSIALEYRAVSFMIALFFLLDVVLQIYVKGKKHYFSQLLNILDVVTIGIIILIDITYIFFYVHFFKYIQRMAVFFRLLRLITFMRIFHLANQTRYLENLIRRLVSGNKRRYAKDGFDLDLTYITEHLIAMSFPSSGKHAVYRNPIEEVVHFLDTRHPEHYFVYNLCSERSYNPRFFHHRMHRILIDDHNVPTLQEMITFSKEVIAWLSKDPQNTIAIHCKGGKGRTGTMICVCLLAMDTFSTAKESLTYFGERRTDKRFCDKFQGVETPSQSRYVGYFETIKTMWNWELPVKKTLTITKIVLYSIKGVGEGNGKDLTIDIIMQHKTVFTCTGQTCEVSHDIETNRAIFIVPNCPALCDDIKLKFTSKNLPNHYDNCAFYFWCNVSLIEKNRLYLTRNELDNPHKPKTWSIYDENFAVELYFEEVFV